MNEKFGEREHSQLVLGAFSSACVKQTVSNCGELPQRAMQLAFCGSYYLYTVLGLHTEHDKLMAVFVKL